MSALDPVSSKSSLSLGDIDLDAVRPLRGRVLPEGRRPLGRHEAPPGLLSVSVRQVQGFLPCYHALLPDGLLWYWSWWLQEERNNGMMLFISFF